MLLPPEPAQASRTEHNLIVQLGSVYGMSDYEQSLPGMDEPVIILLNLSFFTLPQASSKLMNIFFLSHICPLLNDQLRTQGQTFGRHGPCLG